MSDSITKDQFATLVGLSTQTNELLTDALEAATRIEAKLEGSGAGSGGGGAAADRFNAIMEASIFLMNRFDESSRGPHLKATATGIKTMLTRAALHADILDANDKDALDSQTRFGFTVTNYKPKPDAITCIQNELDNYYSPQTGNDVNQDIRNEIIRVYQAEDKLRTNDGKYYTPSSSYHLMVYQLTPMGVPEELIYEICMIRAYDTYDTTIKYGDSRRNLITDLARTRAEYLSGKKELDDKQFLASKVNRDAQRQLVIRFKDNLKRVSELRAAKPILKDEAKYNEPSQSQHSNPSGAQQSRESVPLQKSDPSQFYRQDESRHNPRSTHSDHRSTSQQQSVYQTKQQSVPQRGQEERSRKDPYRSENESKPSSYPLYDTARPASQANQPTRTDSTSYRK